MLAEKRPERPARPTVKLTVLHGGEMIGVRRGRGVVGRSGERWYVTFHFPELWCDLDSGADEAASPLIFSSNFPQVEK